MTRPVPLGTAFLDQGTFMTCREFVEFLWRYIDNELPQAERTTFDDHLAKCPHCVKYLQQYQDTIRIGKAAVVASTDPVPAEVPEDLIQAILHSRVKPA
jgi:anti-sigma factor RsiW